MRIVVIGGTGLIGSKVVQALTAQGHEAVAAAPSTGVNAVTGEGLSDVLAGASVVADVSNSPSFDDAPSMEFFTKSTTNLLAAEADAGVGHHVALSVVGTDFLAPHSGYFLAKQRQDAGSIDELAASVVMEEKDTAPTGRGRLSSHDQIQPAIVVVIHELGVEHGNRSEHLQRVT